LLKEKSGCWKLFIALKAQVKRTQKAIGGPSQIKPNPTLREFNHTRLIFGAHQVYAKKIIEAMVQLIRIKNNILT
jgi:hypothetical protein